MEVSLISLTTVWKDWNNLTQNLKLPPISTITPMQTKLKPMPMSMIFYDKWSKLIKNYVVIQQVKSSLKPLVERKTQPKITPINFKPNDLLKTNDSKETSLWKAKSTKKQLTAIADH